MGALLNPLVLLECKQKVGADQAAEIELPLLVHLDCAKRGQGTNAGVNFLTTHLIAAAPDLLTQLTALLAMCERQADFNDDGDGAMFDRARAAIAKATGEPA